MTGEPAADKDRSNFILAAIPDAEWERLRKRMHLVDVASKQTVYEVGKPIQDIYFPLTCVLSMISQAQQEIAVEVATIGREGMAGLPVFLGVATSPHIVVGQVPGRALRIAAEDLQEILMGDGVLHRQLHRYIQATMVQLAQNVACNRLHTTGERAARWLLMTADRVGNQQFPLTQEFLAQMLGVRRATVSLTAGLLNTAGLISYSRGVITITDRQGLEDATCECYGIVHDEFDRLAELG